MRPIPEVLGKFTAREVFLVNCIRDLEQRVDRAEAVLRVTVPMQGCVGPVHVFDQAKGRCSCGHYGGAEAKRATA